MSVCFSFFLFSFRPMMTGVGRGRRGPRKRGEGKKVEQSTSVSAWGIEMMSVKVKRDCYLSHLKPQGM